MTPSDIDAYPSLNFTFSDANFNLVTLTISPSIYLYVWPGGTTYSAMKFDADTIGNCIFGAPFLTNYHVVFDRTVNQVG